MSVYQLRETAEAQKHSQHNQSERCPKYTQQLTYSETEDTKWKATGAAADRTWLHFKAETPVRYLWDVLKRRSLPQDLRAKGDNPPGFAGTEQHRHRESNFSLWGGEDVLLKMDFASENNDQELSDKERS